MPYYDDPGLHLKLISNQQFSASPYKGIAICRLNTYEGIVICRFHVSVCVHGFMRIIQVPRMESQRIAAPVKSHTVLRTLVYNCGIY